MKQDKHCKRIGKECREFLSIHLTPQYPLDRLVDPLDGKDKDSTKPVICTNVW